MRLVLIIIILLILFGGGLGYHQNYYDGRVFGTGLGFLLLVLVVLAVLGVF